MGTQRMELRKLEALSGLNSQCHHGNSSSTRISDQQIFITQKRILCVDDDQVGSLIRGDILESEGYSVVTKYCPVEALSCDLSRFDLAVVDFQMPIMNGRELLLRMRAMGATFPIILLSAMASFLSEEERVLFSRCVDKGEPVSNLLDVIATFLDPHEIPDFGC